MLPDNDPTTSHLRQERHSIYYNETKAGKHIPRSILVDLDPKFLVGGPLSCCVPKNNIHTGQGGCNNNWARGHYTDGGLLIDAILESVRREVESCDCIQGFQMPHSIGGGTGAGLGTCIISKLKEEYPDRIILTCSVAPCSNVGDPVVAPYNAVISLNYLSEEADLTLYIDNEAVVNLSQGFETGNFNETNTLISNVISGLTSSFRFPSPVSLDLPKLAARMVPFPRLHFFVPAFAPNTFEHSLIQQTTTLKDLIQQRFIPKCPLTACDPSQGKFLGTTTIYRGLISINEIEHQFKSMPIPSAVKFASGCSENMATALCTVPQKDKDICCTYVNNTTAIQSRIIKLGKDFDTLFKKKAFLHPYLSEGMDEMEFVEAKSQVMDLISVYQIFD